MEVWLLSVLVFLPVLGAIILAFLPNDSDDFIRYVTLAITAATFVLSVFMFLAPGAPTPFAYEATDANMQHTFTVSWIPSFDIYYYMGIDGISFPLVILTTLISLLAMGASWSITKYVKAYCILFLILETAMLGVFLSLNFVLFFVFWEVMLLPMYFLIGVWGGPRREYAAIKFFIYTLLGGVLMLVAILLLYFNSDLREVAKISDLYGNENAKVTWANLHINEKVEQQLKGAVTARDSESRPNARIQLSRANASNEGEFKVNFEMGGGEASETVAIFDEEKRAVDVFLASGKSSATDVVAAINANPLTGSVVNASLVPGSDGSGTVIPEDSTTVSSLDKPIHTFNMLALAAIGQHSSSFGDNAVKFSRKLQMWAFLLLFIGFIIKVPSVPFHTWLPDAHVEAPTPISMILAGVLLKMGGYGIIRICYPICPFGGFDLRWIICLIGVVSMVYGGFAAFAQKDFKRLVAYSSVSHMGYVVLGLGVWSIAAPFYNGDYWLMGIKGAMFQMIAHGVSSAGMFFMVGVIYDRVHHRNLNEFGALFSKMPVYTALSIGIFFAGLGLPGLCGFIGEVLVVLSVWQFSPVLAIISAFVVIITAAYILWAVQRVYLGVEYKGPHEEALVPSNTRENLIAGVLFVLAIIFGVFPHQTVLKFMDPTIDRQVIELTAFTEANDLNHLALPENESSEEAIAETSPRPATANVAAIEAPRPHRDAVDPIVPSGAE